MNSLVGSTATKRPHVSHNSGNYEWYTPAVYIEAARSVLGKIDLDPASSSIANATVQAARYYTVEDDGLTKKWAGNVWMNPPYSAHLHTKFIDKLAYHVMSGDVKQAIVLVNNATETAWFSTLVAVSNAFVFPNRRIRFNKPDGSTGPPLQGQAFAYIGNCPHLFLERFRAFGWGFCCRH